MKDVVIYDPSLMRLDDQTGSEGVLESLARTADADHGVSEMRTTDSRVQRF